MKKLGILPLFFASFFCLVSCKSSKNDGQVKIDKSSLTTSESGNQSNCAEKITESSRSYFEQDALRFTAEEQKPSQKIFCKDLHLNPTMKEKYLGILSAIFELNTKERNEIITVLKLHHNNVPSLDGATINAKKGQAWVQNLIKEQVTGIPQLDSLKKEFGLKVKNHMALQENDVLRVSFDKPIAIFSLSAYLSLLPGLVEVEPLNKIGESSKIAIKTTEEGYVVTFTHGFGDCQAGCIYHHHWEFLVDKGCKAKLLREFGDPIK